MALTADEKRAHLGEMMRLAIQNGYGDNIPLSGWVSVAKKYRTLASYGTLADRTEAMKAWIEWVAQYGFERDPVADRHWYINHFVEQEEPGDGGSY